MRNLIVNDPAWIKAKAILFFIAGTGASVLLFLEKPTVKVAFLLTVAIWSFCRLYYFAFYVIEHYVDPGFKFSGLGSFVRYILKRGREETG